MPARARRRSLSRALWRSWSWAQTCSASKPLTNSSGRTVCARCDGTVAPLPSRTPVRPRSRTSGQRQQGVRRDGALGRRSGALPRSKSSLVICRKRAAHARTRAAAASPSSAWRASRNCAGCAATSSTNAATVCACCCGGAVSAAFPARRPLAADDAGAAVEVDEAAGAEVEVDDAAGAGVEAGAPPRARLEAGGIGEGEGAGRGRGGRERGRVRGGE